MSIIIALIDRLIQEENTQKVNINGTQKKRFYTDGIINRNDNSGGVYSGIVWSVLHVAIVWNKNTTNFDSTRTRPTGYSLCRK